jgi:hypothetical protein
MYVGGEERVITMSAIMDVIDGNDSNRLASNQFIAGANRLAGAEAAEAATELPAREAPIPETPQPRTYNPSRMRVESPVNMVGGYEDRGISKLGSILESAMHSKIGIGLGIAAGIGATGLMFSNLTSADSITPESRPHNDETIQEHHQSGGGTARVEMNGEGLNGVRMKISGRSPGHINDQHIGSMANQALQSSGIQANLNIRSQDDTSSINQQWLQQQFSQLINTGYVGGS